MLDVESDVLVLLWPRFLGLEELLPDVFVRGAEEAFQDPWPLRIELPHVRGPELAGESAAKKHHMHHVYETGVLAYHVGDAFLEHLHLCWEPPFKALGSPGGEPRRGPRSEVRHGRRVGIAGYGDIEPLLLPHLDSLPKGPLRPDGVGELAHHGAAAVRMLPIDHLRLQIEDLEP